MNEKNIEMMKKLIEEKKQKGKNTKNMLPVGKRCDKWHQKQYQ